jgi:hypothetical protein
MSVVPHHPLVSGEVNMNTDQAYADRLQARLRAADARLDELESSARAKNAQADMDKIAALKVQRDRVRSRLDETRRRSPDDVGSVQSDIDNDWRAFQRSLADAGSAAAWDQAREQRFNAHLDEVDAALRGQRAKDAEVAANLRVKIGQASRTLKAKLDSARENFAAWRDRRDDEAAVQELNASELALDEAFDDYASAVEGVVQRAR